MSDAADAIKVLQARALRAGILQKELRSLELELTHCRTAVAAAEHQLHCQESRLDEWETWGDSLITDDGAATLGWTFRLGCWWSDRPWRRRNRACVKRQ